MVERITLEALLDDDCGFMVHKESDLKMIVDKSFEATHHFGLIFSLGKTEVLLQPAPASTLLPLSISIEGTELKRVEDFMYLASVISSDHVMYKKSMPGFAKQARPLAICDCVC